MKREHNVLKVFMAATVIVLALGGCSRQLGVPSAPAPGTPLASTLSPAQADNQLCANL